MGDIPDFQADLKALLEETEKFRFLVRDAEHQRQACVDLEAMLGRVRGLKAEAIDAKDEALANWLLGWESILASIVHEFQMLLNLKLGRPETAWDDLIQAQGRLLDGLRSHSYFSRFRQHQARLENLEATLFPPQFFMSAGMIVRRARCSICGANYGDCEHLVGYPYMGELCRRVLVEFEADHVALVDTPANKHCRVIYHREQAGRRNQMTWALEPLTGAEPHDDKVLHVESVILTSFGDDLTILGPATSGSSSPDDLGNPASPHNA